MSVIKVIMKSNGIKTLAMILSLATVSLSYQAMASNSNIETVVNQPPQERKTITGKVVHVDEESISCYKGSPFKINALSDFKYEIIRVATSEGDTLKLVVPQSTEYIVGDKFSEYVVFSDQEEISLKYLVKDNSQFDGVIQRTYLKVDGVIKR